MFLSFMKAFCNLTIVSGNASFNLRERILMLVTRLIGRKSLTLPDSTFLFWDQTNVYLFCNAINNSFLVEVLEHYQEIPFHCIPASGLQSEGEVVETTSFVDITLKNCFTDFLLGRRSGKGCSKVLLYNYIYL